MVWTTDSRLATLWLQKNRFCFRFFDSHLDNFWIMELHENSYGYLLKHGSSFAGAYSPGGLGVRRTPCDTEHDVTFSRSCDQGKITNTLWRYLCIFQPEGVRHVCTWLLSYWKRHFRKLLLQLWGGLIQGWVNLLPCCFDLTNQDVRHSRRTPAGLKNL